ncbi:hypothetical protein SAMN04487827_1838 [Prevotella sp. khp7]|nr:hypothetical protein SAMN04487827_1838 [Prevotella sp. khp7]
MCYFHSIRLPVQPATSGGRLPPFFVSICDARFSLLLTMHFPNALQRYNIFRQIPIFRHP